MAYDQASYLKGYSAALRVVIGYIGERAFGHREYGTAKLTVEALRKHLVALEEDNHALYSRICDEAYRKEASEANQDWPGHDRSCKIVVNAHMHPEAKDCTCGATERGDRAYEGIKVILGGLS